MYILFGCMVKFQFLAQFSVDHLSYTVMFTLEFFSVLSVFVLVLMASLCCFNRLIDSVYLLSFPLLSHVQIVQFP